MQTAGSIALVTRTIKEAWNCMSQKEKKNIIHACIEKTVLTNGKIEVLYNFTKG